MFHRIVALRSTSYVLSRPSFIKSTLLAARVSTSQTNSTTNGNAQTVDSGYPTVTREIDADIAIQSEVISNTPAESIPSSGPLTLPPLFDAPPTGSSTDWSRSYHGLSTQPFPSEAADILLAPINPLDIEMKPGASFFKLSCLPLPLMKRQPQDGMIYLPEIKYRRILNRAFGPGGWGLAPRSETNVGPKIVSREYALVCLGR
jgi:hypothetical protein